MKDNYQLAVLTPVHIGDGDSYTRKEYYISDSKGKKYILINRVNLNEYVMSLSSNEQNSFFNNIKTKEFKLESTPKLKKSKIYHTIEDTIVKDNKLEHPTTIESTMKNNENKAYIPGSSIKGSIKTAILYDLLKKENKTLNSSDYDRIVNSEELVNIMSNISISDSNSALNMKTIQPKSITLLEKNEKSSHKDDKKSGMYNAIECIDNENLKFNLQLSNLNIDYIKECLYNFNKEYIEHELNFYSKIKTKENNNAKRVINWYNQLNKFNTLESPLIRIGGSTGLLSTTIALHMKIYNRNVFLYNFKDKDGNPVSINFPKIRKITPNDKPFGWCRLKTL